MCCKSTAHYFHKRTPYYPFSLLTIRDHSTLTPGSRQDITSIEKAVLILKKMPYLKVLSTLTFWDDNRLSFTHPSMLFSFYDKCYKYMWHITYFNNPPPRVGLHWFILNFTSTSKVFFFTSISWEIQMFFILKLTRFKQNLNDGSYKRKTICPFWLRINVFLWFKKKYFEMQWFIYKI